MKKAFFLDRDGTINVDTGYVGNPNNLTLLAGAAQAIHLMNEAGYLVIVISNQSGVARGFFGVNDVDAVNKRINELLQEENAHIDRFYYCPHLAKGIISEFAIECNCRKPKTGMFEQAVSDFNLDIDYCFACGDNIRDVVAPERIGVAKDHLGILDRKNEIGHYTNLLAFTESVLKNNNQYET